MALSVWPWLSVALDDGTRHLTKAVPLTRGMLFKSIILRAVSVQTHRCSGGVEAYSEYEFESRLEPLLSVVNSFGYGQLTLLFFGTDGKIISVDAGGHEGQRNVFSIKTY